MRSVKSSTEWRRLLAAEQAAARRHRFGASRTSVLRLGGMRTPAGRHALEALDEDFIARWISPGGSANLIAVTHFLYEVECRAAEERGAASPHRRPSKAVAVLSR